MNCPNCEIEMKRLSATYPVTYECGKCGRVLMQNPKALIDE